MFFFVQRTVLHTFFSTAEESSEPGLHLEETLIFGLDGRGILPAGNNVLLHWIHCILWLLCSHYFSRYHVERRAADGSSFAADSGGSIAELWVF